MGKRDTFMNGDTPLSPQSLRVLLKKFWSDTLEIENTRDGLAFTMPQCYPDGWQIILSLSQKTPRGFFLSDKGKTLSWLQAQGQNISTESIKAHRQRLYDEHYISEDKGVLYRWLEKPLDPSDVHIFAEGLCAISRLDILNEHRATEENVADMMVKRIFSDAGLSPRKNQRLNITKERKVTVDYFIEQRRPLALQLLKAKSDISGNMEKWGFRWRELKKAYVGITPIMLYDRSSQIIDPYSRHIGDTECELFCGYDETDRIHRVFEKSLL